MGVGVDLELAVAGEQVVDHVAGVGAATASPLGAAVRDAGLKDVVVRGHDLKIIQVFDKRVHG